MFTKDPQYDGASTALAKLCEPFYDGDSLRTGCSVLVETELPQPYRTLLAHTNHMTATLREHCGQSISLEVLAHRHDGDKYSRQILLRTAESKQLIEFGVVTMHLDFMEEPLRRDILQGCTPLGDLLMQYNVLRRIEPLWFLKIDPGATLLSPCAGEINNIAYGRVGTIHCNDRPAIELLEVVIVPVEQADAVVQPNESVE